MHLCMGVCAAVAIDNTRGILFGLDGLQLRCNEAFNVWLLPRLGIWHTLSLFPMR